MHNTWYDTFGVTYLVKKDNFIIIFLDLNQQSTWLNYFSVNIIYDRYDPAKIYTILGVVPVLSLT